MKSIYKFPLDWTETNIIHAHVVRPLCVRMQDSTPVFYTEVATYAPSIEMKIHCIGTGRKVPESATYLGTLEYKEFIWHFYYEAA